MYAVTFSDLAVRQLKKLEREMQKRVITMLERIRVRPENYVKRLFGEPYYRVRIGDYRAIVDIKTNAHEIFVMKIGHRKESYKNL